MESTIPVNVRVADTNAHMRRVHGTDAATGTFLFVLLISAPRHDVFIPLSAASGKKPAGFVYQIEGTASGEIATAEVSAKGEGITEITSGTIHYAKIPAGKTATIRVIISIRGRVGKDYAVVIDHVNYKGDPNDARYQKYQEPIRTPFASTR